ncbi:hypothetical protein CK500_04110 [Halorubrum salipaludis]|uniref:DUF1850 domain-containing protein n=1 Tax=Halorubrum salipaludis TaxID=2032630 RepID=A0A2A2FIC5_9EURY|nr:DUF1850 domain-containing protein [Halorubrum salipaludis]PAU84708.1 hypothetical protein CK500_04110 [Halorubrum salipaludis]
MALRSRLPSGRRGTALAAVALVAVLAATTGAAFAVGAVDTVAGGPTLVVTDERGTELVTAPVSDETEIVIEYTHSVEKTTVRDVYAPRDGELVMTRMEFSSFGAGLPSQADVTERDGRYVFEPPSESYATLHLKTGTVADHDLIVGDERYDIAGMTDGGAVDLTVERRVAPGL